jgi:ferredoxin
MSTVDRAKAIVVRLPTGLELQETSGGIRHEVALRVAHVMPPHATQGTRAELSPAAPLASTADPGIGRQSTRDSGLPGNSSVQIGSHMFTVKVDKSRCSGHARCHAVAPDLFPLDDQGFVDIDETDVASDHLAEAQSGESLCPEQALTIAIHDA